MLLSLKAPRFVSAYCKSLSRSFKERAGKSVRPGTTLVIDGAPHRVNSITQGKKGKGGGFVKAKVRSLLSGHVFEKTYLVDEVVEHADVEKEVAEVRLLWLIMHPLASSHRLRKPNSIHGKIQMNMYLQIHRLMKRYAFRNPM